MSARLAVVTAAVLSTLCAGVPSPVRADDHYPFQSGNNFSVVGTISNVDGDRERLQITGDDGQSYAVDAFDARVIAPSGPTNTSIGDLTAGMRVRLTGYMLGKSIIAAQRLELLTPLTTQTTPPPATAAPAYRPETIQLRGTVETVNDDQGTVLVLIKDHTRTIYVDPATDMMDISSTAASHIGLTAGDRITVRGLLQADGSVKATGISRSRQLTTAQAHVSQMLDNAHQIVGEISHASDKYSSRDIKVLVRPDREITVNVGHDATVYRDGKAISVHDLQTDEVVRVRGTYDGAAFKAERVEVLPTFPSQ